MAPEPASRLESWKEIAAYLKRDVRTVQRWEVSEDLPVHRHQHKKRGSVYAYPAELDAWRDSRRIELFDNRESTANDIASEVPAGPAPRRRGSAFTWVAATAVAAAVLASVVWVSRSRPAADPAPALDAPRLFGEALRDGGRLDRIALNREGSELVLAPDGATVFVAFCQSGDAEVQAIDVQTGTVNWRVGGFKDCAPLVASSRADRLFLPDTSDIVVVETSTRTVRRFRTPAARISGLALARDDRTLYVAAVFAGLLAVDTETGHVKTISALPCPVALALTPSGDRLYVNYQCSGPGGRRGHDAMEVFDTRTNTSVTTITDLPNVGGDVAVSPDGSQVWADGLDACFASYYDQAGCPKGQGAIVNVIRATDHTLLRSLRLGPAHQHSKMIGFTTDGRRAVVSRLHTTVVSTASLTALESSPMSIDGRVAFSRDGRLAYALVAAEKSIAILPIADHPAPPPGLTARWTFDGLGTDAAGGNDLPPLGDDAFAPGRVGLSLAAHRAPPIRLSSPTNLDIHRGQLTAMAWIKPEAADGRAMTVMEYGTHDGTGWFVAIGADGHAMACVGRFEGPRCDPAGAVQIRGTKALSPHRWHHIAITSMAGRLTLYVNGDIDGTAAVSSMTPLVAPWWLRLGSNETGFSFAGRLDEVEIYGRALNPEEVRARGK